MGEVEAKKDMVIRHDLRHDQHMVSLLSWIARRIKRRSGKLLRDRFSQLKVWCPGHLWAPSYHHGSVGHGWEVVERYILGQKGYEKTDTVPVVVVDEEKEKFRTHKTWYTSLYNKLFGGKHQKYFLKNRKVFIHLR